MKNVGPIQSTVNPVSAMEAARCHITHSDSNISVSHVSQQSTENGTHSEQALSGEFPENRLTSLDVKSMLELLCDEAVRGKLV